MDDIQDRLRVTIDPVLNDLSSIINTNNVNLGMLRQDGQADYTDNNSDQIAFWELQRGILNWAQGHHSFALGIAGELNSVHQPIQFHEGKINALVKGLKNLEDGAGKGGGKGGDKKWAKPITDDRAWDGLNVLSTSKESMID